MNATVTTADIAAALSATNGNMSKTAEMLGTNRRTLGRRIEANQAEIDQLVIDMHARQEAEAAQAGAEESQAAPVVSEPEVAEAPEPAGLVPASGFSLNAALAGFGLTALAGETNEQRFTSTLLGVLNGTTTVGQAVADLAGEPETPVSPYVADPANPTDAELAAAIERGLADGTMVDSADWMARHEAEAAEVAAEPAPAAEPKANWTHQAGRKNVDVAFPGGVVTPIAFHRQLIADGLALATLTTQRVYSMLTCKGFPVRHFDADGHQYQVPQDRDGERVTRPGVDLAAAIAWYTAKYPVA